MPPTNLQTTVKDAFRENLHPALVMNIFVATVIISFYNITPVNSLFNSVGEIKANAGYSFSSLSTAFFGGFLPTMIAHIRNPPDWTPLKSSIHLLFFVLWWGYEGVQIDALYRLQSHIFGSKNDFSTLLTKVVVDQFLYNPIIANPTIAIAYEWEKANFNFAKTKQKVFERELWVVTYPSMLISVWMIWIPAVTVVYSLPGDLQIPLFNIVLVFNCIILNAIHTTNKEKEKEKEKEREKEVEGLDNEM